MNLHDIKTRRDNIESHIKHYSDLLKAFPRSPNGLIPDSVRSTPEYRECKALYDYWFSELRALNGSLTNKQKRELRTL